MITGAGSGLGRELALRYAREGARLGLADINDAGLEETRRMATAAGGWAFTQRCDVRDFSQLAALEQSCEERMQGVDVLINNAGILRDKSFHKMTLDDFRAVIDVHLVGSAICTHAVWPIMREQTYGRVILTSSPSGLHGIFGQVNYGAAKAGMIGMMNALHLEGAKYNIKTNVLSPSAKTRMTEDLGIPEEILNQMTPEAIAAAMLYLVSEAAPSRAIVSCAAGGYSRAYVVETDGVYLPPEKQTPEEIAENWDQISSTKDVHYYENSSGPNMNFIGKAKTYADKK